MPAIAAGRLIACAIAHLHESLQTAPCPPSTRHKLRGAKHHVCPFGEAALSNQVWVKPNELRHILSGDALPKVTGPLRRQVGEGTFSGYERLHYFHQRCLRTVGILAGLCRRTEFSTVVEPQQQVRRVGERLDSVLKMRRDILSSLFGSFSHINPRCVPSIIRLPTRICRSGVAPFGGI